MTKKTHLRLIRGGKRDDDIAKEHNAITETNMPDNTICDAQAFMKANWRKLMTGEEAYRQIELRMDEEKEKTENLLHERFLVIKQHYPDVENLEHALELYPELREFVYAPPLYLSADGESFFLWDD